MRDWFTVSVTKTTGADWLRIPAEVRGHWLALMSVCAQRSNGGVIEGARSWTARDWDRVAGLTRGALGKVLAAGLAIWRGEALVVVGYDADQEDKAKKATEQRRKAAIKKHYGSAGAGTAAGASADADDESRSAARSAEENRREENRKDLPQTPSSGRITKAPYERRRRGGESPSTNPGPRALDGRGTGSQVAGDAAQMTLPDPPPPRRTSSDTGGRAAPAADLVAALLPGFNAQLARMGEAPLSEAELGDEQGGTDGTDG